MTTIVRKEYYTGVAYELLPVYQAGGYDYFHDTFKDKAHCKFTVPDGVVVNLQAGVNCEVKCVRKKRVFDKAVHMFSRNVNAYVKFNSDAYDSISMVQSKADATPLYFIGADDSNPDLFYIKVGNSDKYFFVPDNASTWHVEFSDTPQTKWHLRASSPTGITLVQRNSKVINGEGSDFVPLGMVKSTAYTYLQVTINPSQNFEFEDSDIPLETPLELSQYVGNSADGSYILQGDGSEYHFTVLTKDGSQIDTASVDMHIDTDTEEGFTDVEVHATEPATFLGLPYTNRVEVFDGFVLQGDVNIGDAFDIEKVEITDSHSTGVMSLLAKITEVRNQERLIPTDFTKPVVKGYPIKEDGTVDREAGEVEDELTEIEFSSPIAIEGVPVKHLWKGSGNVLFYSIQSSVVMDNRSTMLGYGKTDADKCVYVSRWAKDIPQLLPYVDGNADACVCKLSLSTKSLDKMIICDFVALDMWWDALAPVIAEYPALAPVIAEYPALAPVIAEYPDIVNSLTETGKRNVMTFDGNSQFDSGVLIKKNTFIECDFNYSKIVNESNIFGNISIFEIQLKNNAMRGRFNTIWADESGFAAMTANKWFNVIAYRNKVLVDGVQKYTESTASEDTTYNVYIGYSRTIGSTQLDGIYGKMTNIKVTTDDIEHIFVPVADNTMVDLYDCTVIRNIRSGTATFSVEPK